MFIAEAEIRKANIFFPVIDRDESELVLDPYAIKRLRLAALPSQSTVEGA
jgi:hypothetical protein